MTTPDDLTEIEHAGRRCAVCHTRRRWRQFEVVRPEGRDPVVMCAACRTRYGAEPPAPATPEPVPAPVPVAEKPAAPRRSAPQEDRLRKTLRELPHGNHSVGRIAKAAGLNHQKTLSRLHAMHAAGEI